MQSLTAETEGGIVCSMAVNKERLSEMIAFRVPARFYQMVKELAESERRKMSEVELAIFERGLAAYQRDGLLFEPTKPEKLPERSQGTPPAKIPAPKSKAG